MADETKAIEAAAGESKTMPVALTAPICKAERRVDHEGREYRYVLGPVLVPNRVDLQKDWATPGEIENACHRFMMKYQRLSAGHRRLVKSDEAVIVESYTTPIDLKIGTHEIPQGTWMIGARIYEAKMMKQVDDGVYRGFSVEGDALHVPKKLSSKTTQ